MSTVQQHMVISWIVGASLITVLLFNFDNDNTSLVIILVGGSIYYYFRSDVREVKGSVFDHMSSRFKLFTLIHYSFFAFLFLYVSIYKPELVDYGTLQIIIFMTVFFIPIIPIVIKTEYETFINHKDEA